MSKWFASTFTYPWALLLLLLPTAMAIFWALAQRRRQRALEEVAGIQGLISDPTGRRRLRLWIWLFAVNLLAFGVAGPYWGRDANAPASKGRDMVVILDVSRSMLAEEPENRLIRAKRSLLDLADTLQRKGGYRIGLVAFAGKAKLLCPLTEDIEHFRFAVMDAHPDRLGPGGRLQSTSEGDTVAYGTWLRQAIETAVQTHERDRKGFQEIMLISDGDDIPGDWTYGADAAREAGIPVYTLGVGDPERAYRIPTNDPKQPYVTEEDEETKVRKEVWTKRQDATLREIADRTDAYYYPEEDSNYPLVSWFETRVAPREQKELVEDQRLLFVQRYAWFYGGALALLILEMLLAESRRRAW